MNTLITATADTVRAMLDDDKTLQEVVDATGWPHQQVKAVAARESWLWSPDGRAYDPRKFDRRVGRPAGDPEPEPALKPAPPKPTPPKPAPPKPAPPKRPQAPTPTPAVRLSVATVAELVTRAADMDDKAVQRELTRVTDALARLRAAVGTVDDRAEQERQRKAVLDEVAQLEEQLAAAKARAKELAGGKGTTPKGASRPDREKSKAIRAWAAEHGVECSDRGKIPQRVVDQYEAANGGTA